MQKPVATATTLFEKASKLPAGAARDEFLIVQCGSDAALRSEVESLLLAHDQAGNFLRSASDSKDGTAAPTAAPQQTLVMNAAAYAEVFLRDRALHDDTKAQAFVDSLPEAVRGEARQRIEAGLRARQMTVTTEQRVPKGDALPRLPGFTIERELGAGSLGVVYAARDEKLNRRVAIKVLRSRADPQLKARVLEEARKAAGLGDPAVVTIFSVLDETDPPVIVMEFVEGFSLDRFAAQLEFSQKARLLREIARGLAAAHEHGLVHRDLKPDNIVVGPDMRPRILDFGLALSLEEANRQRRVFEGTPLYASPEQVLGKALTPATDVFSFGSLMFKVLTGRPPFTGETSTEVLEAIATTAPPFLRELAVGVPEDLQAICLACLAWDPADRPSASEVAVELGRFLAGETVRLKPKLYDDLLRRTVSEYSRQAESWQSQSVISRDERDALEAVHRVLLADEDHWIIGARRITPLQTILSASTWLAVVASALIVWQLRDDLGAPWRWLLPTLFTAMLFWAGYSARKAGENLAAATFLAGAALAIAPATLSLLAEIDIFSAHSAEVEQLFSNFTNQQVLMASFMALGISLFGWRRLKMTGFAWTTATLAAATYIGVLLTCNWLKQERHIMALWCLPLVAMEPIALVLEGRGRVRWTLPFHLVALLALVIGLDVIAAEGKTFSLLGIDAENRAYFDEDRRHALSFVCNGLLFLGLMILCERAKSLDLRRASKLLEVLAIVHTLSALYYNAIRHRSAAHHELTAEIRMDVWFYVVAAIAFTTLAPFRSRWRLLVGGLAGCGLGSWLLVDFKMVNPKPFIVVLGFAGLLVAIGTFLWLRLSSRVRPAKVAMRTP